MKRPLAALVLEPHDAIDESEQAVVLGAADVLAGLVASAALADQNAAAGDDLSAETLDAEPLSVGVASVVDDPPPFLCAMKDLYAIWMSLTSTAV